MIGAVYCVARFSQTSVLPSFIVPLVFHKLTNPDSNLQNRASWDTAEMI